MEKIVKATNIGILASFTKSMFIYWLGGQAYLFLSLYEVQSHQ